MPQFNAPDGTELFFTDTGPGTGSPVLCLAGLTRNGTDFDYVAPHMIGHRLIRLDYRGRGKSAWADPATYTIPHEAQDVLALLDHLGIDKVAILGTSRGGLIAMMLGAMAKDRLTGVCLNDIGPVIERDGLDDIMNYLGRNPTQRSLREAAEMRAKLLPGFENVPEGRWFEEVSRHYIETPQGLQINYDPRLRNAVVAAETAIASGEAPPPDLWPLFDALDGLPLALIRGENSNLLSGKTAAEMRRRRPDMRFADVPARGHVPFLDEPAALEVIHAWLEALP